MKRPPIKKCFALLSGLMASIFFFTTDALSADDNYIAGYATAVLEREFRVASDSLRVRDGVITIHVRDLAGANREQVVTALSHIRGAVRVEIVDAAQQPLMGASGSTPQPSTAATQMQNRKEAKARALSSESGFLPPGQLFAPLLADPRWPHFSAAYRYYISDEELDHASVADFGETFALYRSAFPLGGQWELGLQAGVFSLFDIDSRSFNLINADYTVGLLASYRYSDLSAFIRIFHQSSHLGDEFLLRNRVDRINLSYEHADLKLSYDLFDLFRLYGGGGILFDKEPSDLKPWITQYGLEFESPWTSAGGFIRPIGAVDLQHNEEHHWSTDLSVRVGIQLESVRIVNRKLQLLVEYFNGHSPNGQFFRRKIETIGLGAHLHF